MVEFKTKSSGDATVLSIEGELSIEHARDLKAALVESIENSNNLIIELERVTGVDLAGLQLFCSAHRTAEKLKKHLAFSRDVPEAFKESVRNAGYLRHKGCMLSPDNGCLWRGGNK